jgi:ATP-dependent Zn protease
MSFALYRIFADMNAAMAYHESAHAVVARALGMHVIHATIKPDQNHAGGHVRASGKTTESATYGQKWSEKIILIPSRTSCKRG